MVKFDSYFDPPEPPEHPSIAIIEEIDQKLSETEKIRDSIRDRNKSRFVNANRVFSFAVSVRNGALSDVEYRAALVSLAAECVLALCDHDNPPEPDPDPSDY